MDRPGLRLLRRAAAGCLAAATLSVAAEARADDGPATAINNMLKDSPTLTIVSGGVLIIADVSLTGLATASALQHRNSERGVYIAQAAISAPQALGFALAPFFFDIQKWDPEENLLLLLPFQAWGGALTTHAIWSLIPESVDPAPRLGVSFLIGMNWAFSATALGGLSHERWAPFEVGIAEATLAGAEFAFTVERAADDEDHPAEWGVLAAWSAVLCAHGVISSVYEANEGRTPRKRDVYAAGLPVTPYFAPAEGGGSVGISGPL